MFQSSVVSTSSTSWYSRPRVEPNEAIRECRDPKDDKYLALAAAGRADVIVSGDARHLLSMNPWRGIAVLSPRDFLAAPTS
jgi:predicted nucleic acid-binding protein